MESLGSVSPPATEPAESRRLAVSSEDAASKEPVAECKDVHDRMGWLVLGDLQGVNKLTRSEWQSFLLEVNASSQVSPTLHAWSGFRVSEWRAASDDLAAEVPLCESVELIFETIVEGLAAGIMTEESQHRLRILEEALKL